MDKLEEIFASNHAAIDSCFMNFLKTIYPIILKEIKNDLEGTFNGVTKIISKDNGGITFNASVDFNGDDEWQEYWKSKGVEG